MRNGTKRASLKEQRRVALSIQVRRRDFEPYEEVLAFGHAMLDGTYTVIRRRQDEFHSIEGHRG
ncbi:hypothetical protein GOA58_29915 [Sinorhizobium meliloti]|jgi:hypothetical protein|uniref:hypothetical protein n=1 Tax=Rhizobium meliloti TaxID=382 RepID=UPI00299DEF23|nr:hypothetical protein [Sinorhizobium meliloti]MDW9664902.1 hypothetical protein [Sinorhizobium meliloti]MDX0054722.1 hypothetical protein [Sinorhizobium meliloti]